MRVVSRSCVVEEPAHAEKQHAREPGDLWSASKETRSRTARKGPKPQCGHAHSGGVGPRHTTDEPAEQRRELFSGGWGGKGVGQGEHRSVRHESDTERETSVPGIERCATSSKGKEAGTVHGIAAPGDGGSASGQLLRVEAESGTRSRRRHLAGV